MRAAFVAVVGFCAFGGWSAWSQPAPQIPDTIQVRPGFAVMIHLPVAFDTAIIGDPNIADVTPRSDKTLIIQGHKVGSTNLIVLDAWNKELYAANIVVGSREFGRMQVHGKGGSIHGYRAYQCNPTGCRRIDDPQEMTEPQTTVIQIPMTTIPPVVPRP